MDGATAWRRFWHITLPLVKPALLVAMEDQHQDAQRPDHPTERLTLRAAVDHRRLLELGRHLLEERGEVPHRQRQRDDRLGMIIA